MLVEKVFPKYEDAGYKVELDHVVGYHTNIFVYWNQS
jgi:hypothetical protein